MPSPPPHLVPSATPGVANTEPILTISDVFLTLGGRSVLNGLSLEAHRGQITAILGPNGAGKTTAVRCCTGLLTPDSGTIQVAGTDPTVAVAHGVLAVMGQSVGAWSGIRTGELLGYLAQLYAHPQDINLLAAEFGLTSVWRTPYRRLSGGQQQAVNFAAAIIGRPAIVFLDEPTTGMDPHARRHAWTLLRDLRAAGVSVVLTTHSMDEAAELADHVWILSGGQITIDGTVAELTASASLEEIYLTHTDPSGAASPGQPRREGDR